MRTGHLTTAPPQRSRVAVLLLVAVLCRLVALAAGSATEAGARRRKAWAPVTIAVWHGGTSSCRPQQGPQLSLTLRSLLPGPLQAPTLTHLRSASHTLGCAAAAADPATAACAACFPSCLLRLVPQFVTALQQLRSGSSHRRLGSGVRALSGAALMHALASQVCLFKDWKP